MEGKRSAMVISGLQNDPCSTLPLTNSTGEGMSLTIRYPSTVHLFSLLGLRTDQGLVRSVKGYLPASWIV